MSHDNLFFREDEVILTGEALIAHPPEYASLNAAYIQLLEQYKKLFRQTKRLVRMNDRHQADLTSKTKELNLRNQFIKKTFGRYMSDDIVEKLLESPNGLNLGGESMMVTVVITDLRGFSSISATLPPETVVGMLNDYLKEMTHIIFKYAGTVNEFTGDGILILFGAPISRADDAERAIACAIEMQLAMEKVNVNNRRKGFPDLEMGIGINTGKVIAGNVGSDMRVKYAVVGSNVNLAARVESYTVGGQILATESTLKHAQPSTVHVNGEFLVPFKGVKKPVMIYNVTGIAGIYHLDLPQATAQYHLLPTPLNIHFEILDGKHSYGNIWQGCIVSLAEKSAVLIAQHPLSVHDNLKVIVDIAAAEMEDTHLYAKIVQCQDQACSHYEIYFTFVPEKIRLYFKELCCL